MYSHNTNDDLGALNLDRLESKQDYWVHSFRYNKQFERLQGPGRGGTENIRPLRALKDGSTIYQEVVEDENPRYNVKQKK